MRKILERFDELKRHKERMRQLHMRETVKHLQGRHDQREHGNWADGMGGLRDGGGGGGGRFESNTTGGFSDSNLVLGNRRQSSVSVLANRRQSNKFKPSRVSNNRPSLRPERLAGLPIAHKPIVRPDQRRKIAQQQQLEWKRRHRMTRSTAELQGMASPSAMFSTPIDSRYGNFSYDTENNKNLFENPNLITGVDDLGNPTNFLDFHDTQMDALSSRVTDVLQGLVDAGSITEEWAQEKLTSLLLADQIVRQTVMRKAAASFAMDIQGFVGGQVYSTDDVEFENSLRMANEANSVMSTQRYIVADVGDQITNIPGISEDDKAFFDDLTNKFIDEPYNKWTDAQMKKEGVEFPSAARLARVNPALSSDIFERGVEQSSGAMLQSTDAFVNDVNANINVLNKPATNTDRITMSLPALMSFLHPKIREQLKRLMTQAIQYPANENPSVVMNTIPGEELNYATRQSKQILSSLIDSIHSDGGMSDVSVVDAYNDDAYGYFSSSHQAMNAEGIPDVGNPIIGMINTENVHQDLPYPIVGVVSTLAHELAHHMDGTALPFGVSYFRENISFPDPATGDVVSMPYPVLTDIIGTAGGVPPQFSDKAQFAPPILEIMNRYRSTVQSHNQSVLQQIPSFAQPRMRRLLAYLDQPSEVFARLYQQYVMMKMRDRLQSGKDVDGIGQADRQRALESVDKHLSKKMAKSKSKELQYFFDEADIPTDQLEQIFSIMGWKIK